MLLFLKLMVFAVLGFMIHFYHEVRQTGKRNLLCVVLTTYVALAPGVFFDFWEAPLLVMTFGTSFSYLLIAYAHDRGSELLANVGFFAVVFFMLFGHLIGDYLF